MIFLFNIGGKIDLWQQSIDDLNHQFSDHQFHVSANMNMVNLALYDCIISTNISSNDIVRAINLKYLFCPKTGVDNLPLSELALNEVVVCNSHANAFLVAERALALALSLTGSIVKFDNHLRNNEWYNYGDNYFWPSISELNCGILGMGHIGLNLLNLLTPFKSKIFCMNRSNTIGIENVQLVDSLKELCSNVDLLFICVPLTDETKNSINEECIKLLKGGFIVNVARAELIEEQLLFDSLNKNILAGAALDVWYNYPDKNSRSQASPSSLPFSELSNVIMSPHAGSHSSSSYKLYIDDTIANITEFLKLGLLRNQMTLSKFL